jgi:hypothetical protein
MFRDPIVDEVRKARQAHAAKFNYDLQAIFDDLKKQETATNRRKKKHTIRACNNRDAGNQNHRATVI